MSPEVRQWCIDQAHWFAEGGYRLDELEAESDQGLAQCTLDAWHDYARSQGAL